MATSLLICSGVQNRCASFWQKWRPRYAVPAENYFILTWMEDAEKAAAKVNSLKDEDDSLACIVDLTQEWTRAAE